MSQPKLLHIPLSLIRENPEALRNCDRESEQYLGLVESIRKDGVLNAINVREIQDPVTGQTVYGLIDGLQRFTASCDAGKETIPAQILEKSQAEVLEAQIIANIHKVETRPIQYTEQLTRILQLDPTLTCKQLAKRLSRSEAWLGERLNLRNLDPKLNDLVNEEKIPLANAYALAKLPVEDQAVFLEAAMTQSSPEFVGAVRMRLQELKDAKRKGRDAKPVEFKAHPFVRKIGELKYEFETSETAKMLLNELKVTDPFKAFQLAISWALNMDPVTVAARKVADDERKAKLKAESDARKVEREAKKKAEAREKAAELVSL